MPLISASVKRIVTPVSVMNSDDGKPASTASAERPAYDPTSHAIGMASSPTLMRDVQLIAMTSSNAQTDTAAADMNDAFETEEVYQGT